MFVCNRGATFVAQGAPIEGTRPITFTGAGSNLTPQHLFGQGAFRCCPELRMTIWSAYISLEQVPGTRANQDALRYSDTLKDALRRPERLWDALRPFDVLIFDFLRISKMSWYILVHSQIFWDIVRPFAIFWDILRCSDIFWDVMRHSEIFLNVLGGS